MSKKEDGYQFISHSFYKPKYLPWSVCRQCGLLTMNNRFTEWCIAKGCDHVYHPSYQSTRKKFTELGV